MTADDTIQKIIAKAKAQNERRAANSQKAQDAIDEQQRRRHEAAARWPTFDRDFLDMIADVNAAIEPGGIMLGVNRKRPGGRAAAPNELGSFTIELDNLDGGNPRTSMTLTFYVNGNVGTAARSTPSDPAKGFTANIIDTPMSRFRELILRYCELAVSA